jgi:hypothetical protein
VRIIPASPEESAPDPYVDYVNYMAFRTSSLS